jgi:hypothetical protein
MKPAHREIPVTLSSQTQNDSINIYLLNLSLLQDHISMEASGLSVNDITRRLKWKKPFELVRC